MQKMKNEYWFETIYSGSLKISKIQIIRSNFKIDFNDSVLIRSNKENSLEFNFHPFTQIDF